MNFRQFEKIIQEVFHDCYEAFTVDSISDVHIQNLKQISVAVIYREMASQGGRAELKMDNLLLKWNNDTVKQLLDTYEKKELKVLLGIESRGRINGSI